jgi:hypothetical protein
MGLVFGGGTAAERQLISRGVRNGKLTKLHSGIYSDEVTRDLATLTRENVWEIAAYLFPGGLISHRTALDPRPTREGLFFVTHKRNRRIEIHGITMVEIKGPAPIPGDHAIASFNIFQSQYERAILENLQTSRGPVSKSLGREFVEQEIYNRLLRGGEKEVNRIRDRAREIAREIDLDDEFAILNKITGALLATQPSNALTTGVGKAVAKGEPFDAERLKMLESLAIDLSKENFPRLPSLAGGTPWFNFSFFEAYFSNYIEGTILSLEEAKEVIDTKQPLPNKRNDSHDVLGTFALTNDKTQMSLVPKDADELMAILRRRHATLLSSRLEKNPGMFKERNNQAGSYQFVDHRLVTGTIKRSFRFYDYLKDPVSRAFYVMFMVAEIHPFEDGNGRIARLMMNAELTSAGLTKIMIPNVYRTDYLGALRAMSLRLNSIPFTRMLARAFEFSATLTQPDFGEMEQYLRRSNAFETDEGMILQFERK